MVDGPLGVSWAKVFTYMTVNQLFVGKPLQPHWEVLQPWKIVNPALVSEVSNAILESIY